MNNGGLLARVFLTGGYFPQGLFSSGVIDHGGLLAGGIFPRGLMAGGY